ncbi:MAG: hypothetical protein C5B59_16625 [Bacteroidetes bacterium]|nr:MAG: hypothetical protein C5B59_16625 [Bacteroidota bacterium]
MRKHWVYFISLLFIANFSFSQVKQDVDELKKQLIESATDTAKFRIYEMLTTDYLWYADQSDSAGFYAMDEFKMAQRLNQPIYLAESYVNLGWYFGIIGDQGKNIEYLTKAVHLSEDNKCFSVLMRACQALCITYSPGSAAGNPEKMIKYARKAESLLPNYDNDRLFHYGLLVYNMFFNYYKETGKLDSAYKYAHRGDEEAIKYPRETFSLAYDYEVQAEVHDSRKEYDQSAFYFEKAINTIDTLSGLMLNVIVNQYSNSLQKQGKYEQALFNSRRGFSLAMRTHNPGFASQASYVLYKVYDSRGNKDSALYYLKEYVKFSESLSSETKRNQVQNLNFAEEIRNKEQEKKEKDDALQRKHNLQYAAIAIFLIGFVTIYLLLSQSIISAKLVKYLGLLGLLVSFEFINLLLHPFISSVTSENPFLMLPILVAIGALLIPLHHRLELWVTHKLVEKNKRLKEEKIKKIVEAYQQKMG